MLGWCYCQEWGSAETGFALQVGSGGGSRRGGRGFVVGVVLLLGVGECRDRVLALQVGSGGSRGGGRSY